jgi:hypothetical protein
VVEGRLPSGVDAKKRCALPVLHGRGDDFRCPCRALVDQHDHGQLRPQATFCRQPPDPVPVEILLLVDEPAVEELRRHSKRSILTVPERQPQIEDQAA